MCWSSWAPWQVRAPRPLAGAQAAPPAGAARRPPPLPEPASSWARQRPSSSSRARPPAGRRKVYWHNMREEPVIYINGKPYVVREADQPFCNLEYTGIDRSRVEEMEVCWGAGFGGGGGGGAGAERARRAAGPAPEALRRAALARALQGSLAAQRPGLPPLAGASCCSLGAGAASI
jgi:hypothetical protein